MMKEKAKSNLIFKNIENINNFIEEMIINNYFKEKDFKNKLSKFIEYELHKKRSSAKKLYEIVKVDSNERRLNQFYEVILNEIYIKVLIKLRSDILQEEVVYEVLDCNDTSIKFDEIFTFTEDELVNLINLSCEHKVVLSLKKKLGDNYGEILSENIEFMQSFHKDNALIKVLALNFFSDKIINKAFLDTDNPDYKIEFTYNNLPNEVETLNNKKADKFKTLYNKLKLLCEKNVIKNNTYINKWTSLYQINEIGGLISIVALGYYLEGEKIIGFDELVQFAEANKYFQQKNSKNQKDHEIKVINTLLQNKLFILNYLLENPPLLERLFECRELHNLEFLEYVFEIIDNISEKMYEYIKAFKSRETELEAILNLNVILGQKDYYNLFNNDLMFNDGREIVNVYKLYAKKQ